MCLCVSVYVINQRDKVYFVSGHSSSSRIKNMYATTRYIKQNKQQNAIYDIFMLPLLDNDDDDDDVKPA